MSVQAGPGGGCSSSGWLAVIGGTSSAERGPLISYEWTSADIRATNQEMIRIATILFAFVGFGLFVSFVKNDTVGAINVKAAYIIVPLGVFGMVLVALRNLIRTESLGGYLQQPHDDINSMVAQQ